MQCIFFFVRGTVFFPLLLGAEVFLVVITLSRQGIISDLLKKHLPFWIHDTNTIASFRYRRH